MGQVRPRRPRFSFTVKFAAVILVAGAMVAVLPLLLARAATTTQALQRASDKAGIVSNLVGVQRSSLQAYAGGVARQLSSVSAGTAPAALTAQLRQDESVNEAEDVLAVTTAAGETVAVQDGSSAGPDPHLLAALQSAVRTGAGTIADASGGAWMVASAPVQGPASAMVARPITAAFLEALRRSIATTADTAGLALVRDSQTAAVSPAISGDLAVAVAPVGGGFSLVVSTSVPALVQGWQPALLVVSVILGALLIIVAVVQSSLQQPLRRLDRAVAAMGRGDFDEPVPTGSDDELGRLGATFEEMRNRLRATMRATAARAAVATQMSASQPLETSLRNVCAELHANLDVDAVMIVVTGSEMSDPFTVVQGMPHADLDGLLSGDGPLGAGHRYTANGALLVDALPASDEARFGLREFCVAPLRVGKHVHGVLAVGCATRTLAETDVDLVSSTAEQVALGLERYRFLAVVQRQASIDDLTSLYNHRFLVDYLGQQVALSERLAAPLAILMLDIDHFKALNDTHGHQAGDTALAAFAQTLLSSVRRSDLAARYGGEEFSVVMANTTAADAHIVAEKIRAAVSAMRVTLPDGTELPLTVSVGGAAYPEDTDSAGELLALADAALYRAKRAGRNRTAMAGEARRAGARCARLDVVHTRGLDPAGSSTSAHERHRSPQ